MGAAAYGQPLNNPADHPSNQRPEGGGGGLSSMFGGGGSGGGGDNGDGGEGGRICRGKLQQGRTIQLHVGYSSMQLSAIPAAAYVIEAERVKDR